MSPAPCKRVNEADDINVCVVMFHSMDFLYTIPCDIIVYVPTLHQIYI